MLVIHRVEVEVYIFIIDLSVTSGNATVASCQLADTLYLVRYLHKINVNNLILLFIAYFLAVVPQFIS